LSDIAIIGAGPYALSLAAHLRKAGVDYRVFGKTMESWKHRMPPGMLLKSYPWSSSLYDPEGRMTLEAYCRQQGIAYHESAMDTQVELYARYGEAFQRTMVPDVAEKKAVNITATGAGFRAVFDDGETATAKRIVLAIGVHAFSHIPPVLSGLPDHALSHSGDYGPIDGLDGREVVVLGSGASAINMATLLHERGVSATLLARSDKLGFADPPPVSRRPLLHQMVRPDSGIGAGWPLWICANAPWLFRQAPAPVRRRLARRMLGPLGGASMKERLIGKVPVLLGRTLESARAVGDRVELRVRDGDGAQRLIMTDHVIAATGFRIDVERLSFLDPSLRQRIRTIAGAPVLSQDYETSAPGLHVIGPATADCFGPVARFVFGAYHPARRLTRRFTADLARQPDLPRPEPSLVAERA
jgi:cation diffusion facilitator CzcD-associated flavoprotein CzcO